MKRSFTNTIILLLSCMFIISPSFSKEQENFSGNRSFISISDIHKDFKQGESQQAKIYKQYFALDGGNSSIYKSWQKYWCGINYTMVKGYKYCVRSYSS